MTEQVIYELGLRDKLSAGIEGATGHVNMLEKSLGSVGGLLTGIGVGLATFKLAEFAHEANEEWEKMEFAMSQVQAGIKSTGGAAGLTFEELKKGAEDLSHNLKFTQAEVLGMQSLILTFPSVTKDTFKDAEMAVLNLATRMGSDAKTGALQLGKALQSPEHGLTALRKAGVNVDELKEKFKTVTSLIERQKLIIRELGVEFAGSALAAAEADKSFRLDKTMEENKVVLGEFLDQIKEQMMPALISVANAFKNTIVWVKKNWEEIKRLGIALGEAWVIMKAGALVIPIIQGIGAAFSTAAAGGIASATAGMTAASTAALTLKQSLGLLAVTVAAGAWIGDKLGELYLQGKEVVGGSSAAQDENSKKELEDLKKLTAGKNSKEAIAIVDAEIKKRRELSMTLRQQSIDAKNEYGRNDLYAKANIEVVRENAARDFKKGLGLIPSGRKGSNAVPAGSKTLSDPKTKATGSKSVTINVVIQKLGETIINTTNIKEGAKELHNRVVSALTGAVNDFQIVAQNS